MEIKRSTTPFGESWGDKSWFAVGENVCVAACRAIVYDKFGDTVTVPDDLVEA